MFSPKLVCRFLQSRPYLITLILLLSCSFLHANPVVYKASKASWEKKIVFVASDHEYRAEETLPALARILAVHHGFDCTVLFGLSKNGEIEALDRKQGLDELTENLIICPTNEMIDKLGVYAEAGVDEIIISSDFGQTQNELIDSMYRIGEEVMPHFKSSKSKVA